MKCPFCGAPATVIDDDDPQAWLEESDSYVSLHRYDCLIDSSHTFYARTCKPE